MKHGNLKSFVLGVLSTVMVLGLALPAAATVGTKTAVLYYNNIKIRLNGQEIVARDANGNAVEPFIIDGTTYLSVRGVASALGLNVGWDGATQTVILGDDPQSNQPAAWLGELSALVGEPREKVVTNGQYDNFTTANNGATFDRSFYNEFSNGYSVSYALNGQYKRFTGTFYLPRENRDTPMQHRLIVNGDGKTLYTSPVVAKGVEPIPFDIDISNVNQLELVAQYYRTTEEMWQDTQIYSKNVRIGNAALWTK